MWRSSWYALDSIMISGFFGFSRRSFWINSRSSRLLLRWSTQMSQTQYSFSPCFFFFFLFPFYEWHHHSFSYPSSQLWVIATLHTHLSHISAFQKPTSFPFSLPPPPQVQNHFIFFCSFLYLLSTCMTEKSRKYKWDIDDNDTCYYVLCCFKGFTHLSSLQPL